jgi:hypothetical protein
MVDQQRKPDYCFACKRPFDDWHSRSNRLTEPNGNKRRFGQGADITREDRAAAYKNWHSKIGQQYYATDIDQIEWRGTGENTRAVAILELTRIDGPLHSPFGYRRKALARITKRDWQSTYAQKAAKMLGVDVFYVLFTADLSQFHVTNLSKSKDGIGPHWWWVMSQEQYRDLFLRKLGETLTPSERAQLRALRVVADCRTR